MSSKQRASSVPSQAGLMRMRGDLRGTSARFRVQLDKPSPATIYADPISRIGMEVKRHDSKTRLVVHDVDENPRQRTPVAQWNTAEDRQADRGDEEQHASLAIKPGDRIKAVNDLNSATLMISELQEAAKPDEPKPVNLEVSRDISNVLAPSPPKAKTSAASAGPSGQSVLGLAFLRPLQVSNRRLATPRYAERRPESIDVRSLLQQAGLILPEPTETLVSEEESLEVETPIGLLQQGISQRLNRTIEEIEENLIRPNRETVVAEDEEIEIETPLSKLDAPLQWLKRNFDISPQREKFISEKKAVKIETPLSALFPGILDEAFESTESWTDLLLPLLDAVIIDSMDEANYVTVTVEKPLGVQIEENPKESGGGVAVKNIMPDSNAERCQMIQPGYQLVAASGIPVHGLHLEDAARPIEAAKGRVQLTFFKGSADTFNGLLGPDPEWLSAFLRRLQVEHFAWSAKEGTAPKKTWSWALELLKELKSSGQVDSQTLASAYGAAMEACQRASRWEPALELLEKIRRLGPVSPADYRSAILACERGGGPLQALCIFEEMLENGLEPDPAAYNSAVGACRAILRTLQGQASLLSPARGDRGRSVTESGWRASSRSKERLSSGQLPGMPLPWDAGVDAQFRHSSPLCVALAIECALPKEQQELVTRTVSGCQEAVGGCGCGQEKCNCLC
ncbi:PTAC2 [Symbiodinium pilosum]|uniref:PTAC2 protein n=1 Tax=Symbiodinium pilosum TaxID=2952 RepID=A0A812WMN7_SYMPI|nr:PTAC2 [Symbiodinium pilosum]